MEELSVDEMLERYEQLKKDDQDMAIRNLVETILSMLEFKDLARDVYDDDFWNEDKEARLSIENVKNFKLSDIVFFKEPKVKKRVLKLFERLMDYSTEEYHLEVALWDNLYGWLGHFSECKVREFRNFATQLMLALFGGLLRQVRKNILDIRGTKNRVKDSTIAMIKSLCKHYHCEVVKNRLKDIDPQIRSVVIDHVFDMLSEMNYFAVDEAVVMAYKKNNNKSLEPLDMVKQGPLTKTGIEWLMKGLGDATLDRVCRHLMAIPKIIGAMSKELEANQAKEWDLKGHDCIDICIGTLKKFLPILLKYMAEEREEVGSHIVHFFLATEKESLIFERFLEGENLQTVCSMITSSKKKLVEAAADFIFYRVGEKGTEAFSKREEGERLEKFVRILVDIEKFKATRRGVDYEFDEDEALFTVSRFVPKICSQFDSKVLIDSFLTDDLGKDNQESNKIHHFKAYTGCILHAILNTCDMAVNDRLPSGKAYEGFKGDFLTEIKEACVHLKTQVKEHMKKGLAGKTFSEQECLRVYLKLLLLSIDQSDENTQELLVNLYDRSVDRKTLREAAKLIRELYENSKSSSMAHKVFNENITRLYDSQIENLNKAIQKLKKETHEKGLDSLSKNNSLKDQLRICLRKVSPLKHMFQVHFNEKDNLYENLCLILDMYVTEKLDDKEILEHCIVIISAKMLELAKIAGMGGNDVEARVRETRNSVLDYFKYFIDSGSLARFQPNDAMALKRFAFVYLVQALIVSSSDSLADRELIYFKPDESYLQKIWEFVEGYCFTGDEGGGALGMSAERNREGQYELNSDEKKKARAMDAEEPARDSTNRKNTGASARRSSAKPGQPLPEKVVSLRINSVKFREDAVVVVVTLFKLAYCTFRSIGMNLATRLIYKLLNLEEHQGLFVSKIERFFEDLVEKEKTYSTVGKLFFWRLIKNCIDHFDLATLKKLSKVVFTFYRRHASDTALTKAKYLPFCMSILQGAQETTEDPNIVQKALLFVKKNMLEQESMNRLLYLTQHSLENICKEAPDLEAEKLLTSSAKYKQIELVRDSLAELCNKQVKEEYFNEGNKDENKESGSRRASKSIGKKKNRGDVVEIEAEEDNKENRSKDQGAQSDKEGVSRGTVKIKGKKPAELRSKPNKEANESRGMSKNAGKSKRTPSPSDDEHRSDQEPEELENENAKPKAAPKARKGVKGKKGKK
jgi:hypothetical protein